jgi:hypothetical protein
MEISLGVVKPENGRAGFSHRCSMAGWSELATPGNLQF